MKVREVASRRPAQDDGTTPLQGFAVIVGKAADGGCAFRIEDPARLFRVWALLQGTANELNSAALPPEGIPRLQRQLQVIRGEVERAVSPSVAAELQRIMPSQDAAPSAGALRIECAVLVSWAGSLVMQMLSTLVSRANDRMQAPATPGRQ